MSNTRQIVDDVPLPIALGILLSIGVGLALLKSGNSISSYTDLLDRFMAENETLLILSGVGFFLNVATIGSLVSRLIGFKKQGSRLKTLRGKKSKPNLSTRTYLMVGLGYLTILFGTRFLISLRDSHLPLPYDTIFDGVLAANFALATATSSFSDLVIFSKT